MKLITKTILYYLLLCVPLILIAFSISYFLIKRAVNESLNEEIWSKKRKAEELINSFEEPREVFFSIDNLSSIKVDSTNGTGYKYKYLIKMDAEEDEQMWYWELKSYYKSKGVNYVITITEPKFENDDLIESLSQMLLLTIAFLIFSFFILNWIISRSLWKPFYKTINALNTYDIKKGERLQFDEVKIKEFKQLNKTLEEVTTKIRKDYKSIKEFTENASHETQTPLAVIKARLDLLMQSPKLGEDEMSQLQVIERAVNKLSSLNKALLLLTKIENHQFKDVEEVSFNMITEKALANFEDMIASRSISVTKEGATDLKVKMHPLLADILVGNLIQNAVRHNINGGKIGISASENTFTISNTGEPLKIETSRLFERFKKNDDSKESLGLGLSIIKSISEAYGFKVEYVYKNAMHQFSLLF